MRSEASNPFRRFSGGRPEAASFTCTPAAVNNADKAASEPDRPDPPSLAITCSFAGT